MKELRGNNVCLMDLLRHFDNNISAMVCKTFYAVLVTNEAVARTLVAMSQKDERGPRKGLHLQNRESQTQSDNYQALEIRKEIFPKRISSQ
jgi:hypothetical protein